MMVKDYASQRLDRYIIKFPDGMRDQLKKAEKENNRSLNAEIICQLGVAKKIDNEKNAILGDASKLREEQSFYEVLKEEAWKAIAGNEVMRASQFLMPIDLTAEQNKNSYLRRKLSEKYAAIQRIMDSMSLDLTDKQKVGEARRIAEIALFDAEATE